MAGQSMTQTPTKDEIKVKLTDIFRSIFDDDSIVLSVASNADDIEEWDSLNQIKILLACEQIFKIKVNARQVSTLENVGQMIDYLDSVLRMNVRI
jgi:acyl carrier protein